MVTQGTIAKIDYTFGREMGKEEAVQLFLLQPDIDFYPQTDFNYDQHKSTETLRRNSYKQWKHPF